MKQVTKKVTAVFIAIMMVVAVAMPSVVVKAAQKPTFTVKVDNNNVKPGDKVTAVISLSANTDITGLNFTLKYDPTKLKCEEKNCKSGDALSSGMADINANTPGEVSLVYISLNPNKAGGDVLTITFDVIGDTAGEMKLDFHCNEALVGEEGDDLPLSDITVDSSQAVVNVDVPIQSISMDKTDIIMNRGTEDTLSVLFNPTVSGEGKTINWRSSNPSAVTVDDGKLKAVGIGDAVITAKVNNFTATCNVTVKAPLNTIALNKNALTLAKGQTETLKVTYDPDDTTDSKEIIWTSSDTTVGTVDNSGKVTALKEGTTTIKAKVGQKEDSCILTVKEVHLQSISLDKNKVTIARGQTETLRVTYNPEDTTDDKTVKWTSSDETVATVSNNGVIRAKQTGKANINAEVNGKKAVCEVTVNAPLESIELNHMALDLIKGQSEVLLVSFNPDDTTDEKKVTWKSQDESIVTITNTSDKSASIKAVKSGTSIITAETGNGIKSICIVDVAEIPIESISLNISNKTMEIGETTDLKVAYNPVNTTDDKKVTWHSSNSGVVSVDSDGKVTAISGGKAVIKAITENGKEASCEITVPIHIASIAIDTKLSLMKDETHQLLVTYTPDNTTDSKEVEWKSNDPDIASVDNNGNVTGVREGTTIITATTKAGGLTAQCQVEVKEIHLQGIEIEKLTGPVLKGQGAQLVCNLLPAESTDEVKLIWSSSNEKVATVDNMGMVMGLNAGSAFITVTTTDRKFTDSIEVTVEEIPLQSISFEKEINKLTEGEEATLNIVFNPENTTDDKIVVWNSSDEKVAGIKDGIIKALKAGKTIITAKVGDKTVSYELTVEPRSSEEINNGSGSSDSKSNIKSKNNENNESKKAVKTGDNAHIGMLFTLLFAALAVCVVIIKKRKGYR